ncbi:DUF2512 family protein [Laceyella putida]|jgi:hypothetical protein|uniref:DUF2512 family protein n=1 Tax=Laceyella putida TaxID=110101 RepID=A0ABW2RF61_9BACL
MTGLWLKIVICPIAVILADFFLEDIYYPNLIQPIMVGLVLALVGHLMEVAFLKRGRLWISNALDFLAASLLVYASGLVLPGAVTHWFGSFLTAWLLTVTEHFQHVYLLRTGRAQKEPAS